MHLSEDRIKEIADEFQCELVHVGVEQFTLERMIRHAVNVEADTVKEHTGQPATFDEDHLDKEAVRRLAREYQGELLSDGVEMYHLIRMVHRAIELVYGLPAGSTIPQAEIAQGPAGSTLSQGDTGVDPNCPQAERLAKLQKERLDAKRWAAVRDNKWLIYEVMTEVRLPNTSGHGPTYRKEMHLSGYTISALKDQEFDTHDAAVDAAIAAREAWQEQERQRAG